MSEPPPSAPSDTSDVELKQIADGAVVSGDEHGLPTTDIQVTLPDVPSPVAVVVEGGQAESPQAAEAAAPDDEEPGPVRPFCT